MTTDRITKLRVRGLRSIESAELELGRLTALVGDNGSGKSGFAEAAELLRQAAKRVYLVDDVIQKRHSGLRSLLRHGASELALGVTIEGAESTLDYDFAIAHVGTHPEVVEETLTVRSENGETTELLHRRGGKVRVTTPGEEESSAKGDLDRVDGLSLVLAWHNRPQPEFARVLKALNGIEVHSAFETRATWQQRELNVTIGPRWPNLLESTARLERYGVNLSNAFQILRNGGNGVWQRVVERAKLGLGEDLRDFSLTPFGRGMVELQVNFGGFPDAPVPVEGLSDGQIAYLCFIALCELKESRSLLFLDEPESHLHPHLVARVGFMLEEAAEAAPVVVATHSNQFLDGLSLPAESVRLCALDEKRATVLQCPNPTRLAEWLEDYAGLGSIRAAGYEQHVFAPEGREEAK
jgi:predicted ATPase